MSAMSTAASDTGSMAVMRRSAAAVRSMVASLHVEAGGCQEETSLWLSDPLDELFGRLTAESRPRNQADGWKRLLVRGGWEGGHAGFPWILHL